MRKIAIILICLLSFVYCYAERDWEAYRDSLLLISRAKADVVLSHFDTIYAPKILYSWTAFCRMSLSFTETRYYVIIKNDNMFDEYFIITDSTDNILQFTKIDDAFKRCFHKRVKFKQEEVFAILVEAFDTNKYHTDFITYVPDATTLIYADGFSYFVLKDVAENRYGEFHLSTFIRPFPIDSHLHAYLFVNILFAEDIISRIERQLRCLPRSGFRGFVRRVFR